MVLCKLRFWIKFGSLTSVIHFILHINVFVFLIVFSYVSHFVCLYIFTEPLPKQIRNCDEGLSMF